ncbi:MULTISPECIES: S8 family serine peptidase [unclassified Frigoribacterium]|uniref:S8 family serine peptidase n=1 Tax=unclassified Frigoribacterium TaxID=2627005 RepID=UPI0006FF73E0|nr:MULTISPECIES: S8 family serine peptidase [unclassified Frigoribacterium]KQO47579.1 peptidase S8 [Frigoribacterium sp. Leaf254]KQT39672.1 peptidase S8 [Frigoribacterium sp. Leaf415]
MRRSGGFVVAIVLGALVAVVVPASAASADQVRDAEYWLADYGIQRAWQTTRGAGTTVAVIDTGVDSSVRELQGAVVGGTDVSGLGSPDGQTPVGEDPNHGTLVGSMVAGRGTGSGDGVIGVAPEADLLSVSVGFGSTAVDSDDQIARAVRWAVDAGADVINMSLTRNTLDWPTSWDDAFLYAMQHDVVVVAAAGNRGSGTTEVGAPATMPGVLTVAGVDRQGTASFDASSQGITIGVAAPSEDLVGVGPGDVHYSWSGTSGATPLVAGIVALVRSAHPELDADDVINRVVATATPKGTTAPDPLYGYGLVDAAAAVTASVPTVAENPMGDLAEWIRVHRRADVPAPSAQATNPAVEAPVPTPVTDPGQPLAVLLPTVETMRSTGIPLIVFTVFGGAAVLVAVGAVRQFRRARRSG